MKNKLLFKMKNMISERYLELKAGENALSSESVQY